MCLIVVPNGIVRAASGMARQRMELSPQIQVLKAKLTTAHPMVIVILDGLLDAQQATSQ